MWSKITEFLNQEHVQEKDIAEDGTLKIAIAALLVTTATSDHELGGDEEQTLHEILIRHFGLAKDEARHLIEDAKHHSHHAVDLHRFVSVINSDLDHEQRKDILKYAWEIVLADGIIDNYEDNLMRKLGPLLGISRRDSIFLRDDIASQ
jgi:uncharacterized tellurite resistance protein B-like protein